MGTADSLISERVADSEWVESVPIKSKKPSAVAEKASFFGRDSSVWYRVTPYFSRSGKGDRATTSTWFIGLDN